MVKIILTVVWLMLFVSSESAHAIGPVRCNGRIQFTPCVIAVVDAVPAPRFNYSGHSTHHSSSVRVAQSGLFATIISQKHTRVSERDSVWSGAVSGNGLIKMTLTILRAGRIADQWQIGSVVLRAGRSSTYYFRSVTPLGTDWDWRINAVATPLR